jgi:hypothetical protein
VNRRRKKQVVGTALVVHVAVAALTWRDIRNRPDERVRGNKTFWRVASALNTVNSAAYWVVGRRGPASG